MNRFDAYLLTKPKSCGSYTVLLIDTDRLSQEDKLIRCSLENLQTMYNSAQYKFQDVTIVDNIIMCSHAVSETDDYLPEIEFALNSEITLFIVLEVLALFSAEIEIDDKWYPIHGLSFSMKSDRITYVTEKKVSVIWEPPTSDIEYLSRKIHIKLSRKGMYWLREKISDCIINLRDSADLVECDLYLYKLPCVCSHEYSMLRFHAEELQLLLTTYQQVRAQLHGLECGSWIMHHLAGDETELFSHKKPRMLLSPGKVSIVYEIDFPNAQICSQNLIKDESLLKSLMNAQSFESFCEKLLPLSGCRSSNVYFKLFAAGMLSQLTDSTILKDHELLLNIELLQTTLTTLASRIFAYKITMSAIPIIMPSELQLSSGKVRIVKEGSYAAE